MPAPVIWAAWLVAGAVGTAAASYGASILAPILEDPDPYNFPNDVTLHPGDAPDHTQRVINPLWAPTAYLQGIDCESQTAYKVRQLDGGIDTFYEYSDISEAVQNAARESSLGYAVHVNEDGHAILNLKAMGKGVENKHEDGISSTLKDVVARDEQIPALDMLAKELLADPAIKTIETVGFAQGSEGVYHLAEKYNIVGTNISDTGTNYTSDHLGQYVISLDVPGDVHSLNSTGEHKPGYEIDLGEAVKFSATPTPTSWVEKIQTLAFQFEEAGAPEGYEDKGVKLVDDALGRENGVCDNPTMPQVFKPFPGASGGG